MKKLTDNLFETDKEYMKLNKSVLSEIQTT